MASVIRAWAPSPPPHLLSEKWIKVLVMIGEELACQ